MLEPSSGESEGDEEAISDVEASTCLMTADNLKE